MCSASEEGSYARLIDFVYHSILTLRVIKKKKRKRLEAGLSFPSPVKPSFQKKKDYARCDLVWMAAVQQASLLYHSRAKS